MQVDESKVTTPTMRNAMFTSEQSLPIALAAARRVGMLSELITLSLSLSISLACFSRGLLEMLVRCCKKWSRG